MEIAEVGKRLQKEKNHQGRPPTKSADTNKKGRCGLTRREDRASTWLENPLQTLPTSQEYQVRSPKLVLDIFDMALADGSLSTQQQCRRGLIEPNRRKEREHISCQIEGLTRITKGKVDCLQTMGIEEDIIKIDIRIEIGG